jgi:hypothetical protein
MYALADDLPGKIALAATGHAIALAPGVLSGAWGRISRRWMLTVREVGPCLVPLSKGWPSCRSPRARHAKGSSR